MAIETFIRVNRVINCDDNLAISEYCWEPFVRPERRKAVSGDFHSYDRVGKKPELFEKQIFELFLKLDFSFFIDRFNLR